WTGTAPAWAARLPSSVGEDGEPRAWPRRPGDAQRLGRTVRPGDSAHEVVIAGLLDLDADDLARPRLAAVDVDLAVDLRRLAHPAAFEEQVGLFGNALDQDVQSAADELLLVRLRDAPLDTEQLFLPGGLHPLRELAVEV